MLNGRYAINLAAMNILGDLRSHCGLYLWMDRSHGVNVLVSAKEDGNGHRRGPRAAGADGIYWQRFIGSFARRSTFHFLPLRHASKMNNPKAVSNPRLPPPP